MYKDTLLEAKHSESDVLKKPMNKQIRKLNRIIERIHGNSSAGI